MSVNDQNLFFCQMNGFRFFLNFRKYRISQTEVDLQKYTANLPREEGQIQLTLLSRPCDSVASLVLILSKSVKKRKFIFLHIINSKHHVQISIVYFSLRTPSFSIKRIMLMSFMQFKTKIKSKDDFI